MVDRQISPVQDTLDELGPKVDNMEVKLNKVYEVLNGVVVFRGSVQKR